MDVLTRILFWMDMQKSNNDIYYHVARTILENSEKIPDIGIEELAYMCYTSPATISRFCRKLSFKSFSDFKKSMKGFHYYTQYEVNFTSDEMKIIADTPHFLAEKTFPRSIEALEKTYDLLDMKTIQAITKILAHAKHIAIFGSIYSQLVARDCQYKFIRLGRFTTAFTDLNDQLDDAKQLTKDDAVVIFSVSGSMSFLSECIQHAKKNNTPVIVITNITGSPLALAADYVIELGGVESDFTLSSTSGRIASMGIVDLLYTSLAYYNRKENMHS